METGISLMEIDCHSLVISLRVVKIRELTYIVGTVPTHQLGIYRCDIPTVAVHDDSDRSVRATVYVGLYTASGGMFPMVWYPFAHSLSKLVLDLLSRHSQ